MVDVLHPPESVIESWPAPNYIDPVTRGPSLFIVIGVLGGLATCAVVGRIYSRIFLTKAPGIDDVMITAGLGCALVLSSLVIVGRLHYFSGRHVWDIPPDTFQGHRLNIWVSEWMYLASAACIKVSVLLFYKRLSVKFSERFKTMIWIGVAYIALTNLGLILFLFCSCSPIDAYWNSFSPSWQIAHQGKWHCTSEAAALPVSGGLNVIGDIYTTVLPMTVVGETVQNHKQRLALYVLFGIGFLSAVDGLVRTVYLYKIMNTTYDFTWLLSPMWTLTVIEVYLGIIAASCPALKPFFRRFVSQPVAKRGPHDICGKLFASIKSIFTILSPGRRRRWTWLSDKSNPAVEDPEKPSPPILPISMSFPKSQITWFGGATSESGLETVQMQQTRPNPPNIGRKRQEMDTLKSSAGVRHGSDFEASHVVWMK